MLTEQVDEAARHLCAARRGPPLHELPPSCRPQSDADAYQIQEAVVRQLGQTIGGWKVGAASAAGGAFCAPIWMQMIRPSPASFAAGELRLIGIEAEIAFRLGRDLPARAAVYERAEVTAGAALHPAIEVVDSRYADFRSLDRISILADNFANGGLVFGAAVPDWLIMVESVRLESASAACDALLANDLQRGGLDAGIERGAYQLEICLVKP